MPALSCASLLRTACQWTEQLTIVLSPRRRCLALLSDVLLYTAACSTPTVLHPFQLPRYSTTLECRIRYFAGRKKSNYTNISKYVCTETSVRKCVEIAMAISVGRENRTALHLRKRPATVLQNTRCICSKSFHDWQHFF
ncbi:hypothetical protein TGRUB_305485 [Toxoplasma gondii RUB]|uniref:Uncharacterized protein n=1 Tax=Toxoplasma gondii RUB TaxID=935652 RepID=A0A086LRJ9_TOXGO|nr:hypothetical protein TGRUB_305485 [Toxoplasma gondii RUB]